MTDTADRVMMRLAEEIRKSISEYLHPVLSNHIDDLIATALSSHGLRKLIDANEHTYQALMGRYDRQDALSEQRKLHEPTALMGETASVPASAGETVKAKEQADG